MNRLLRLLAHLVIFAPFMWFADFPDDKQREKMPLVLATAICIGAVIFVAGIIYLSVVWFLL